MIKIAMFIFNESLHKTEKLVNAKQNNDTK